MKFESNIFLDEFLVEGQKFKFYNLKKAQNIFGYLEFGNFEIGRPANNDIIIFSPTAVSQKFYVKRIIASPGESVRIKDGFVYKLENNAYVKLNEYYLNDEILGNTLLPAGKSDAIYTVPEDHYFVLGDNRLQSTDSRNCFHTSFGQPCSPESLASFVAREQIKGRAALRFWPLSKFGIL